MRSIVIPLLIGLVSSLRSRAELLVVIAALHQQLAVLQRRSRRPPLRPLDRFFWTWLSRLWPRWRRALVIVQPETVLGWHRRGFRLYWRWKSRKRGPGRPKVSPEVRALIRKLSLSNPGWGAPHIHGELLKLGIDIGETSVGKYMVRRRQPPSQTWRTFLENHLQQLVAVDFFVVPTLTFRILFVLVVLAHDRRRIVHFNITADPTAEWTAQQIREAFPWETAPRFLLRDWDGVYSPETLCRSILLSYVAYHQCWRTHLALGKDTPLRRKVQPPTLGQVIEIPEVGGLHHHYERQAA
jgi:hypothetical protein